MLQMVCEECATPFAARQSNARFCSPRCADRTRLRKIDLICERCGDSFHPTASGKRSLTQRFCSRSCQALERAAGRYTIEHITPEFGHWLAGLVDGEGCFSISRKLDWHRPLFTLSFRDDDREGLEMIRRTLGFGSIQHHPARVAVGGYTSNPKVTYSVVTVAACRALVELFDKYPLRMKKAKDFAIWREAVAYFDRGKTSDNAPQVQQLRDALQASHRYSEVH